MPRFNPQTLVKFYPTIEGTKILMPPASSLTIGGSSALTQQIRTSTVTNPAGRILGVPPYTRPSYQYKDPIKSLQVNIKHPDKANPVIVNLQKTLDDLFVNDMQKKINMNNLTSFDVALILNKLSEKTEYTASDKMLVYALKDHFSINPPLIEDALQFLTIWKKGDFIFTPKAFRHPSAETNTIKALDHPQESNTTVTKKSFKEMQEDATNNMLQITTKMQSFFNEHETNPEFILQSPLLHDWHTYVNNRTQAIPFSNEEIIIHKILMDIFERNKPSAERLLAKKKDNLKQFKTESNLPASLKEQEIPSVEECFMPQDFLQGIQLIEQALSLISKEKTLSEADYKLLAIRAGVAVVDDEGTFKLTDDAYKALSKFADDLHLKYSKDYPSLETTLDNIKNNKFVIVNDIQKNPNAIVNSAHLSHKSLVISNIVHDTIISERPCILTSTHDGNTILIDKYQQTNPDPQKQNKGQYIRIFNNSILITNEEQDKLTVDMETTLLFHGYNSDGVRISNLLYDAFLEKGDTWSKSPYLYSYIITEDFIKTLTINFYEQHLINLKNKNDNLIAEMTLLTNEALKDKLLLLKKNKDIEQENKRKNQYHSLLPEPFKILHQAIILCKKKINKDHEKIEKEKKDKELDALMEEKKKQAEEEKANKPISAEQARKNHQAKKAKEKAEKEAKALEEANKAKMNNAENEENT